MPLFALGMNHTTAPIEVRERLAFVPEQMTEALQLATTCDGVEELAILSTCNRTELIVSGDQLASTALLSWLASYHGLSQTQFIEHFYTHADLRALRHLIAVASGLDSMVLGEPQIFGQMKSAYALAQEAGTLGSELDHTFQHVFSVAKKVRSGTAIGENPVSVAYAAVSLSQRIYSSLAETNVLLVGAGETIELVAKHFFEAGVRRIVVANRTLGRAAELAKAYNAKAILLADIPDALVDSDIVITSTASQLPIIGKGMVEQALKARKRRPMFMVDIAVPRDIEASVGKLPDVYLYTVDDLREVIESNRQQRQREVSKADEIIDQGVTDFERWKKSLDAVDVLKVYRAQMEQIKENEVSKALAALERGKSADEVLHNLARSLVNKSMHSPSVALRKAAEEERLHELEVAKKLLGIEEHLRHHRDQQDD